MKRTLAKLYTEAEMALKNIYPSLLEKEQITDIKTESHARFLHILELFYDALLRVVEHVDYVRNQMKKLAPPNHTSTVIVPPSFSGRTLCGLV